jgi:hypothetical protein
MSAGRGWRGLVVLGVLPLVAACGSRTASTDASSAHHPGSTKSPLQLVDGAVQVGCSGTEGWAASTMADGLPGVLSQARAEDAFTELLADPRYSGELAASFLADGPSATQWRVLRVDGDTYTIGLGAWTATGPGNGATVFEIQGHQGAWTWLGGGGCQLEPVLSPGTDWVQLTAPQEGLDRSSTDPVVGLTEQSCSSGRDVRPYLHTPFVQETSTTVTVYWAATAPTPGSWNCVGIAPVGVPVHLAAPLGGRTLLDGSTYPPSQVTRDHNIPGA